MGLADLKLLAVEDHEFQRGMLLRMLARLGASEVSTASDGAEALEIIKARNPAIDIVISDLDMPGMDGLEFMRHLGAAQSSVAIILASAVESVLLDSAETMSRAYGVKILGVIQKPITIGKLEALLRLHGAAPVAAVGARSGETICCTPAEIQDGLRRDEFELFYQPKVQLLTGEVTGAEALARWRHPRHGILTPATFVGHLESGELIDTFTEMILRKAARFCNDWRARSGLNVTVAVNLSSRSLADVRFADRVVQVVRAENTAPQHIVLEVTESATMMEVGHALENLSRLRMKGFGLSIDDYGTGYSSMQRLAQVAFNEIKIDRSFVTNAIAQHSARVILESSLDMARKLKVTSVAEGIETRQDWDLLLRLGCDLGQGYFIAKPMDARAFLAWIWGGVAPR